MPISKFKLDLMSKGLKQCCVCKEIFPIEYFSTRKKGQEEYHNSKCPPCYKEYISKYSKINNARLKAKRNFIPGVKIKVKPKIKKSPKRVILPTDVRACKKCGIEKNIMTSFYKKHVTSIHEGYYEYKCIQCTSEEASIKRKNENKDIIRRQRIKKDKIDYSKPIKKKVLDNANYVDNKTLHCEMIVSLARGKLTNKASNMIMLIAYKLVNRFRYTNSEDREDCLQYAYLNLLTMWMNYNPDITHNAFAYFTELSKRALAMQWKRLTKTKQGHVISNISLDASFDGKGMSNYI